MLKLRPIHGITLAFIIFLSACASKTSDRYREGDNSGQMAALTVEEERKLTQEALKEMAKDYPPAQSPELQAYIKRLGQKIVQANNLHQNPYQYNFTVVDVPHVNAFALPAGTIFMTAPIIAMADSEAEIAGVLGHEIGHVTARHTAERMYVAKKEQGKMWALGGAGALLGGAAGFWLGNKICKKEDSACRAKYAVYGLGGGAGAGLLIHNYHFMANSREDELESDRVGFKYALNAGYDPKHIGDFYRKLLAMEKEAKKGNSNPVLAWAADAMSSHPPSNERVKQASEMANAANARKGVIATDEFRRMKKLAQQIVERSSKKP